MTPTEQDLARQLAEHPRWRWMAGMRVAHESDPRAFRRVALGSWELDEGPRLRSIAPRAGFIPDLADPATQGCLWAMLREATGDEGASADYARDGWSCDPFGIETEPPGWRAFWRTEREPFGHIDVNCATLGEALARAVLAAWEEA